MITIKKNLHGYYVEHPDGGGAVFLPSEMLDFIETYFGSVEYFILRFNSTPKLLAILEEAADILKNIYGATPDAIEKTIIEFKQEEKESKDEI